MKLSMNNLSHTLTDVHLPIQNPAPNLVKGLCRLTLQKRQGQPGTQAPLEVGEGKGRGSPTPPEGMQPAHTFIFDF